MAVKWSSRAKRDLALAAAHFYANYEHSAAKKNMQELVKTIRALALSPLKAQSTAIEGVYKWLIMDKYLVYFQRGEPRSIQVFRIYPARAEPLNPEDVI